MPASSHRERNAPRSPSPRTHGFRDPSPCAFRHSVSRLVSLYLNSYFSYGNHAESLFRISIVFPFLLRWFSDEESRIAHGRFQHSTNARSHIVCASELCELHNKAVQHHSPLKKMYSFLMLNRLILINSIVLLQLFSVFPGEDIRFSLSYFPLGSHLLHSSLPSSTKTISR